MTGRLVLEGSGTCPECGKVRYLSRAVAKGVARKLGRHCRVYRCSDSWHLASYKPAGKVAWYRQRGQ